jgi:DNA integrity scanning protein DisA with diadenylate cyclase activity
MRKSKVAVGNTYAVPMYFDNAEWLLKDFAEVIIKAGYAYTTYEYFDNCGRVVVLRVY